MRVLGPLILATAIGSGVAQAESLPWGSDKLTSCWTIMNRVNERICENIRRPAPEHWITTEQLISEKRSDFNRALQRTFSGITVDEKWGIILFWNNSHASLSWDTEEKQNLLPKNVELGIYQRKIQMNIHF